MKKSILLKTFALIKVNFFYLRDYLSTILILILEWSFFTFLLFGFVPNYSIFVLMISVMLSSITYTIIYKHRNGILLLIQIMVYMVLKFLIMSNAEDVFPRLAITRDFCDKYWYLIILPFIFINVIVIIIKDFSNIKLEVQAEFRIVDSKFIQVKGDEMYEV